MFSGDFERCFYVYVLSDPRTGVAFYVGKGSLLYGPSARLRDHIAKARAGRRGRKYNLIRELLTLGLEPDFKHVADGLSEADAYAEEVKLIEHYGLTNLTNCDPGGRGGPSGGEHWTHRFPGRARLLYGGAHHPLRRNPALAARGEAHGRHTHPERTARGSRHGCAKLTEDQVDELRRLYVESRKPGETRLSGRALAKTFGVSPKQVSRILKGGWGRPNLLPHHGNKRITV
jgi:hypothetical protein